MKIAEGIKRIELKGNPAPIYPTLLWDDETVILVDAGFPGQLQDLQQAIAEVSIPSRKLNKIIITHQDYDHIGGLKDVMLSSEGTIELLAHPDEKPYLEGNKPFIKLSPERLDQMFAERYEDAEERQKAKAAFLERLKIQVNQTIEGGEVLPYCGGITVIHTPGHTPGHICLYHHQSKTLIAGDALNVMEGKLSGPNPAYTKDMDQALKSLKKLTQYDIETVICYHGGVYRDKVNQRILELVTASFA